MCKIFSLLYISFTLVSQLYGFCCPTFPFIVESSLEVDVGYRRDKFSWAETSLHPLKEKVKWDHIHIWEIGLRETFITCDNFYFKTYGYYGWLCNGHLKTMDNDPFFAEAALNFKNIKGHVYDISLGLGYKFDLYCDSFSLVPFAGYSWHGIHFDKPKDDVPSLFIDGEIDQNSNFVNPSSRYHFYGPWAGLDIDYNFLCKGKLFASYEYHWVRFRGIVRGNLLLDYDSDGFRQRIRSAHGQIFRLGLSWEFYDCLTASLIGEFRSWRGRKGTNIGKTDAILDEPLSIELVDVVITALKNVKWTSDSILFTLGYQF